MRFVLVDLVLIVGSEGDGRLGCFLIFIMKLRMLRMFRGEDYFLEWDFIR